MWKTITFYPILENHLSSILIFPVSSLLLPYVLYFKSISPTPPLTLTGAGAHDVFPWGVLVDGPLEGAPRSLVDGPAGGAAGVPAAVRVAQAHARAEEEGWGRTNAGFTDDIEILLVIIYG